MTIYTDAERACEDLTRLAVALTQRDNEGRTVLDRIRDAQHGHPKAASYDTDRVSASGTSDPTGNAAMRADKAAADRKRLDRIFASLRDQADEAVRICDNYTPRHPTAKERQQTADWNAPHCENCCKILDMAGGPQWIEPLTKERTTVTDLLSEPMWLCRWCYDHVSQCEGILPNEAELEQHRDGKRIVCPHPRKKAA